MAEAATMAGAVDGEPAGHPRASRRPPRGVTLAVAVLAAAVVAALAAWPLVAAHPRGRVHLLLETAALSCHDAPVREEAVSTPVGPDMTLPVAAITEDMRCVLRVRVENRGLTAARVVSLSVPQLGPAGGMGAESRHMPAGTIGPEPHEVDAVFTLDRPREIEAGAAAELEVAITYRPDGCTPDGGGVFFTDAPTASVAVLGLPGERSVVGPAFGFRGTDVSDCGGELPS